MDFFLICLCTERGVCTLMHEFYRTRHAVTPKDPLTPLLPEFNLCGSKRSIGSQWGQKRLSMSCLWICVGVPCAWRDGRAE
jgi:hypothetical protein